MFEQGDEIVQCGGLAGQVQAQQVGQLADGNHHRCAEGEAKHDRMRDEIDQRTEPQQTQQPLENPGQEGQQQD
ncbi:hypothetical protein D3C80_2132260 [compost metagenome]